MIGYLKKILKYFHPGYQKLVLDYKVNMRPRYGYGLQPHGQLYEIINDHRKDYEIFLDEILKHKTVFQKIRKEGRKEGRKRWRLMKIFPHGIMVFYPDWISWLCTQ